MQTSHGAAPAVGGRGTVADCSAVLYVGLAASSMLLSSLLTDWCYTFQRCLAGETNTEHKTEPSSATHTGPVSWTCCLNFPALRTQISPLPHAFSLETSGMQCAGMALWCHLVSLRGKSLPVTDWLHALFTVYFYLTFNFPFFFFFPHF